MTIMGMTKEVYIAWRMEAYECSEAEARSMWAHQEAQKMNRKRKIDDLEKYELMLDATFN